MLQMLTCHSWDPNVPLSSISIAEGMKKYESTEAAISGSLYTSHYNEVAIDPYSQVTRSKTCMQ